MSEAGLRIEGLTLRRGERLLIEDLSFALGPGDALMLVGRNGSGKTSLLRALAGLCHCSGRLAWDGRAFNPASEDHRARFLYIGHQDGVKGPLSLRDHLHFWAALMGGGDIGAAIAAFGLETLADCPGQYLSAGQRRRLSLARLLLRRVPLWLLDEPVTALDAEARRDFADCLARHRKEGGMAMIASHEGIAGEGFLTLDLDRQKVTAS